MEYLQGGRENKIARSNNTVHRPAGYWSKSVHALLEFVRKQGFVGAPLPLGFDEHGNEILTFLLGDVCNYPLSTAVSSQTALLSAAKLLRAYHDATVSFLAESGDKHTWLMPPREPAEVICHGDYAPYNVVLQGEKTVAIIDFDTAHPAPRVWDIAYALYRWAPITSPTNPDGFGTLANKIQRAADFCNSYGVSAKQKKSLIALTIKRLQTLVDYMITEAKAGNESFQANLADGHHLLYLADIDYIQKRKDVFDRGLVNDNG